MSNVETETEIKQKNGKDNVSLSRDINWIKVLIRLQLILSALCAIKFIIDDSYWSTIIFAGVIILLGHIGVTAGAHRLWAHQSYTASTQLRVFLAICQTLSGTGSIYDWVQWHRLHHKHFGTDLDPYNPSRGWFYAHIQGAVFKLSPAQERELKKIDMSDIEKDSIVMFQKKWYIALYLIVTLLLPINAPAEYWGENLYASVFILGWFRCCINIELSSLIHSATNIWGLKVGEKYPCDTNLVFIINKTNWLSYHYIAPWDYQTHEFGQYGKDMISRFIKICEVLECASNLKTIDSNTIRKAMTISVKEKRNITDCLLELCDYSQKTPTLY